MFTIRAIGGGRDIRNGDEEKVFGEAAVSP